MASTPPTEEAFAREVDEELRREQLQTLWQRYGRIALIVVGLALAAFAAFLFWRAQTTREAERHGEQLSAAIADVQANRRAEAEKKIEALIADGGPGYNVAARFTKATLAIEKNDLKGAAAIYAAIAADEKVAEPFRQLALVRQTLAEFDGLKPQQVVDRMKPLAVEGSPFFGTAGELTAIALIDLRRTAEAGRLLAAIARDENSPATLRARAQSLASSLGADVAPASADKD